MIHCRRHQEISLFFVYINCGPKTVVLIYILGIGILLHSSCTKVGYLNTIISPGDGNLTISEDAVGMGVGLTV